MTVFFGGKQITLSRGGSLCKKSVTSQSFPSPPLGDRPGTKRLYGGGPPEWDSGGSGRGSRGSSGSGGSGSKVGRGRTAGACGEAGTSAVRVREHMRAGISGVFFRTYLEDRGFGPYHG